LIFFGKKKPTGKRLSFIEKVGDRVLTSTTRLILPGTGAQGQHLSLYKGYANKSTAGDVKTFYSKRHSSYEND